MRHTQLQVIEVLRNFPKSQLWNIEIKKWNDEQKKQFEFLRTGIRYEKPIVTLRKPQKKKVVRISDGKIYDSIIDCANGNGVVYATISRHLKKEIKYKYYDSTL